VNKKLTYTSILLAKSLHIRIKDFSWRYLFCFIWI